MGVGAVLSNSVNTPSRLPGEDRHGRRHIAPECASDPDEAHETPAPPGVPVLRAARPGAAGLLSQWH